MEQPKKPGATRDITDLKARLGLNKGAPAPGAPPGAPGARAPFPGPASSPAFPAAPSGYHAPVPPQPQAPFPGAGGPGAAPAPFAPPPPHGAPGAMPAAAQPAAPVHDPFAAMKPPAGRQFDLRPVDDGIPAESVRSRGGKAGIVIGVVLLAAGAGVGYGLGASAVGRRAYNNANAAAKKIRPEIEEMQKTITQINTAIAQSNQRLAAEKKPLFSYDPKLIDDLSNVKLDPRPDTSKIFKTDYARLEDLAVDRLMNFYYDTINLYGEVERFVKKTKADRGSLETFAAKQGADTKGATNYGVVFDSRGKLAIANLVELGQMVCKGGGGECGADKLEGFEIRANSGAGWASRKVGAKPDGNTVVPIEKTPLMEAVMSGSPDQARMEQYRQRLANIAVTLSRITAGQKELSEAVNKAAARPDLMTL